MREKLPKEAAEIQPAYNGKEKGKNNYGRNRRNDGGHQKPYSNGNRNFPKEDGKAKKYHDRKNGTNNHKKKDFPANSESRHIRKPHIGDGSKSKAEM